MSPECLKSTIDQQFSEWMKVSRHQASDAGEVYRVILPLWEPSGDVVALYITLEGDRVEIDDGGHISGLLFESGRDGVRKQSRALTNRLLSDSGLSREPDTGIVRVQTTESGLRYWLMEMGRVIALLPALLPDSPGSRTQIGSGRSRGRTAYGMRTRLIDEGFSKVINQPRKVRGVSDRVHTVDLSYPAAISRVGSGSMALEGTVHVMAIDLDVSKPLEKADRSIAIANDLLWGAGDDAGVVVKLVYGFGNEEGVGEPASMLLAAAGDRSPLDSYSWDDRKEQNRFLEDVGQELAVPSP